MHRTAWLMSLCWLLPEGDALRAQCFPLLLGRLTFRGRAANDTGAWVTPSFRDHLRAARDRARVPLEECAEEPCG